MLQDVLRHPAMKVPSDAVVLAADALHKATEIATRCLATLGGGLRGLARHQIMYRPQVDASSIQLVIYTAYLHALCCFPVHLMLHMQRTLSAHGLSTEHAKNSTHALTLSMHGH